MTQHSEFHGAHARNYNKRPSFWQTSSLVDTTLLRLKPKQRLLDVGCGTGTDLEKLFVRYGESVELYGVEPSKDMLQQLSQSVSESQTVYLSNATADKLPYADSFFNYVTCSLVLHHLSDDDQQKALQEMYRVLIPGGRVLVKEWGRPQNISGRLIAWFWRNHAYVHKSTSTDLLLLLKRAGFKDAEVLSVKRGIMYQLSGVK